MTDLENALQIDRESEFKNSTKFTIGGLLSAVKANKSKEINDQIEGNIQTEL